MQACCCFFRPKRRKEKSALDEAFFLEKLRVGACLLQLAPGPLLSALILPLPKWFSLWSLMASMRLSPASGPPPHLSLSERLLALPSP